MKKPRLLSALLACCVVVNLLPATLATEGTVAIGTYVDADGKTKSYEVSFDKRLTQTGGNLEAGNYYLSDDLTLTEPLVVSSGTVCLDLNGHILRGTGQGNAITVKQNTDFKLYDSDANEDNPFPTVHYYTEDPDTGLWVFDDSVPSEAFVIGGVITGGDYDADATPVSFGGAIQANSYANVAIFEGNISGNRGRPVTGGGGQLLIAGGKLSGNIGGIYSDNSKTNIVMTGGEISYNSGTGITTYESSVTILGGEISHNSGTGVTVSGATFTMRGGEICDNGGRGVAANSYTSLSGPIFGTVVISGGSIHHHASTDNGGGILCNNCSFTMMGGEIYENTAACGGGVFVYDWQGNKASMNGGKIYRNKATKNASGQGDGGGGLYVDTIDFTMTGGEIYENVSAVHGGGLFAAKCNFTMKGGKIYNNTALRDASTYHYGGGGGVYVHNYSNTTPSIFTMTGGEIFGNQAPKSTGGGVAVGSTGQAYISGGQIRDNTALDGGGLANDGAGKLVISGGEITGNTATENGGGIYTYSEFSIEDAPVVTGNTCNSALNNVYIDHPVTSLTYSYRINITGPLSTASKIGVSKYTPGVFTTDWSAYMEEADPADYFVSEMTGYVVKPQVEGAATEGALVTTPTYTATFVADGVTVDTVTFTEGSASLAEPQVPAKVHYNGAWEDYDLAAATNDITVNAVYILNDDHSTSETAAVTPPTCTEKGHTTYTCSVCGNERADEFTDALGHDYRLNSEKSKAPTPEDPNGFNYYECTRDPGHFYQIPTAIIVHTATFMVGDEVIGRVVFEEGSATLDEPAIPPKPNYIGQWEPYDLAATSDITVYGHYTPVDPDVVSDVESEAEAEYDNSELTITLTAKAASRTIKVVSQATKPVDVVLVLDQSGSMADTLSTKSKQSKRNALVSCANTFVNSLYENAVASGVDHRVAVVGFAYSAYNQGKYKNTGLLATPSGKTVNYQNLKESDYKSALLPINNGGVINANVCSGINSIQAEGATAADLGLKMAQSIFSANPTEGERERIVIFITDGTPTSYGEDASLVRQTAADTISVANTLKNALGASIYSVGVHANADPTAAFTTVSDGVTTDRSGKFSSFDFNRFLHGVSSNYPKAAAMGNLGDGDKIGGFYMGVNDTSNLDRIFTNILYSTVYELKTFDKATLYYTLPKELTLTMEQESAMRAELTAQGMADPDIQVIRNGDGTTSIRFQNVRTQEAYGEDGTQYYKATVRFKVSVNQNATGGSIQAGEGGAEYDGSQMDSFKLPEIVILQERCLVAFTINGQVYRLVEVAPGETITIPETELADWLVPEGTVIEEEYTVFEATQAEEQKTYTITWVIDDQESTKQYFLGEIVVPPQVPAKEGFDFTGWSRSIPYSMPAYDLVCEAIYSPAHQHSYEFAYQTGSCTESLTTVYRCACGDTHSDTETLSTHNFVAVLSDNGSVGTAVERVVCTACGHSEEQNISFKVSYSSGWKTTVLDLNLLKNEVSVTEPDEDIEVRFYVGDDSGRTYTVTRIDSDGKRTIYQTRSENGYLIFKANHFSIYVLSELDETTSQPTEEVSYEEALDILDSKEEAKPTAPLEGATDNSGDSSIDDSSSDDSSDSDSSDTSTPSRRPSGQSVKQEEKPTSLPFVDVPEDAWYYEAVRYVLKQGLFNGTSDTSFSPDITMTRAMLVTVLYRMEGEPKAAPAGFVDVPSGQWYSDAVSWAAEMGVVIGYGDGTFGPHKAITREEMAVMLWRYALSPDSISTLENFTDGSATSDWAANGLGWAVEQGIITGKGGGALDPKGEATRAEVAAMLMRFFENIK